MFNFNQSFLSFIVVHCELSITLDSDCKVRFFSLIFLLEDSKLIGNSFLSFKSDHAITKRLKRPVRINSCSPEASNTHIIDGHPKFLSIESRTSMRIIQLTLVINIEKDFLIFFRRNHPVKFISGFDLSFLLYCGIVLVVADSKFIKGFIKNVMGHEENSMLCIVIKISFCL